MNPLAAARSYTEERPSDLALLQRVAAGDESALSALFDRWKGTVFALADRILGDPDDADDVVEETFWQGWRESGRFDATRGTVQTWLLTIARTRSLDRLRARKRRREESADSERSDGQESIARQVEDPQGDAWTGVEQQEQRRMVQTALAGLPVEQRTTLELAYYGGLSQSEIAEQTGEPLGTVKTRTRLALQKLREALAGLQEDRP